MADRNPIEANLAAAVHQAEYEYGKANAAPAGPNRIERIEKAALDLLKAESEYQNCLDGRAYSVPVER
jgi:hypothetical protein